MVTFQGDKELSMEEKTEEATVSTINFLDQKVLSLTRKPTVIGKNN